MLGFQCVLHCAQRLNILLAAVRLLCETAKTKRAVNSQGKPRGEGRRQWR